MTDDADRQEFENTLRKVLKDVPGFDESYLISGLIISEWIMPDGKRYLTRTPIGDVTSWQAQGFLFSTLYADDWQRCDDEEE